MEWRQTTKRQVETATEKKGKYNSKNPKGTWLTPQYEKTKGAFL